MKYIRSFPELNRNDAATAGGKGASLGEMIQAGIPVPPGFVVLASSFDAYLAETDIVIDIAAILETVNIAEMHTVEHASEKVQALILSAHMPSDIAAEIMEAYSTLCHQARVIESRNLDLSEDAIFVAVRSSATAEDGATAAWAGQLDSFLNTTKENLLQNVKKCWASLFTPRAIFYGFEKGFHQNSQNTVVSSQLKQATNTALEQTTDNSLPAKALATEGQLTSAISVAVVVQAMVQSEISGIAFSVHPVTQDKNQLIIEAGYGLGEAIVSGQVTPDSYVVTKNPLEIIDKNVSAQDRMLVRAASGGNEWVSINHRYTDNTDVTDSDRTVQKLSDLQILELSRFIIQIEDHYGFPCDIEWAWAHGHFYMTQSRPITTLSATKTAGLLDSFLAEINDLELAPPSSSSAVFVQASGWNKEEYFNSYYLDRTPFPLIVTMKDKAGFMYWPITKAKRLSEEVFLEYWENPEKMTARMGAYQALEEKISEQYIFLTYDRVNTRELNTLAIEVRSMLNSTWSLNAQGFFSIFFDKLFCLDLLKKCGASVSATRLGELWEQATTSTASSFDKRRTSHIINLLQEDKSWDNVAEQCQYFEANYNFIPGLDSTKHVLQNKYGQYMDPEVAKEYLDKERSGALKVIHDYTEWFTTLNAEEQRLVAYIQKIIKLRDIRKDTIGQMLAVVYRFAEKVFAGLSVDKKYIFYTTFDELLQGPAYLRERLEDIQRRGEGFTALVNSSGEKHYEYNSFDEIKSGLDSHLFKQVTQKDERILSGQTGNPGKIVGRVRVINNVVTESHLFQDGEILVTGMTRPEFVPLMHKAAGVVTDEGGITSHAAIVARELKKPCIIGTKIATQVLRDGDLVEIDAYAGVVRVLERVKN